TLSHAVFIDPGSSLRAQYERGKQTVEALELKLRGVSLAPTSFQCAVDGSADRADHDAFCAAVRRAKEHITEGDIFQVVLSRRVVRQFSGDPFALYRALRMINPSPYLFHLDFGDTQLVGSSPEVLVRSRRGKVEVLPIAGTRRRGGDESEDRRLEDELLNDTKELAEHLMLVDLGRNDIGRLCSYGSVHVPVFKRVERYAHVMHLVSEVEGTLREGVSPVDVLRACFPAGTVSGAPKVRAMEIIAELEPRARGGYAGAVGYIGFDGTLDTCIAIRTIIAHGSTLKIQAGAGIVADSIPEAEYEETVNKTRSLMEAVRMAASGLSSADMAERWGVRR
ncbi:MAG: anthranilate synthase component, partial [Bacteroidetes bacterium]|nr:anthranilate synthase component [Bacteroidota bacterium]